jgi:5-formyltetrahydrofolate cyclo-ligase
MGEDSERTKRLLRREVAAACRGLDVGAAARLAAEVSARAAAIPAVTAARHLVAYAALGREVDPEPVVQVARAAGASVYYPRASGAGLEFVPAHRADLVPGPHGVPEPAAGPSLAAGTPDVVVLVPGVAFDARGGRLGRGLGCYDRALAAHPTALRIGLAYEVQIVPVVPRSSWDEAMDFVVTDARVLVGEPRKARALKEMPSWN